MRLKQVWALGRFWVGTSAVRWMVNSLGPTAPVEPCSARNPWSGTREEPVTNCKSLARISDEYDSTTFKKTSKISSDLPVFKNTTNLPKPNNLLGFWCTVFQSSIATPIVNIYTRNASNNQFQFPFIKWT